MGEIKSATILTKCRAKLFCVSTLVGSIREKHNYAEGFTATRTKALVIWELKRFVHHTDGKKKYENPKRTTEN